MTRVFTISIATLALCCISHHLQAASITGDPSADSGWTFGGNSLANGTYVRGEGTFSFDIYSSAFTVEAGSDLEISDGDFSWLEGDQILGLGGKFVDTTAAAAGWPAFIPNPYNNGDGVAPNDDVSGSSRPVAKWGAAGSSFTTSTTAPFAGGNGVGSLSGGEGGDGAILARITSNASSGDAGTIQLLDRVDRYDGSGTLILSTSSEAGANEDDDFQKVARMMFQYNTTDGHITSWEYLLNVSLMDREFNYGAYPTSSDQMIMTVQRSTNRFTDGLINATDIPEPATLVLAGLAVVGLVGIARRRK